MLVSVIIPCYNEKTTIVEIIDSVLNVKNLKKEIIIIDDCSTDGTVEILKTTIIKKQCLSKKDQFFWDQYFSGT